MKRYNNRVDQLVPMTSDLVKDCKNAYRSYSVQLEQQKKIKDDEVRFKKLNAEQQENKKESLKHKKNKKYQIIGKKILSLQK